MMREERKQDDDYDDIDDRIENYLNHIDKEMNSVETMRRR